MHRTAFLPLAALLFLLTACTGGQTVPTGAPTPTPSPSPSEEVMEHLPFYEEFDRWNNGVDKHDFVISEVRFNGELRCGRT